MTTLVACSHGTASPVGQRTVEELVALVRSRIPQTRVVQAFVDVQEPAVHEVVSQERERDEVVVVPLLLSVGYHTAVDIAEAVNAHEGVRQGEPLGTHPLIAEVLRTRLLTAVDGDWQDGDHVVLAAAGSSNPRAVGDVSLAAQNLSKLVPAPVSVGYASAIAPRIAEAVETARARGARRVIAASHVLAPGYFAGLVARAGADVVAAPLGADDRVAEVVVDRFRRA
ncbi:sirohydrochlorin chelatase [Microbacterium sp. CR_7]|uniref:sirohydrochlorin chelatase n=1 Tax=Microbacterium sp. CR_7 TaxID=3055792 RepID=UPI0035C0CA6A